MFNLLSLITFIFFSLLPLNLDKKGVDFFIDPISTAKEIAENSLVKIKAGSYRTITGSGILINVRNKINVLTNAHVCLGVDYLKIVSNKKINSKINFLIDGKELFATTSVDAKELIYNVEEDWCVVPLQLASFNANIITRHLFNDKMPKKALMITYNRQKNVKKYDKFIGCSTDPFLHLIEERGSCESDPIPQNFANFNVTGKNSKIKKMKLGLHYLYKFPVIPGDSGSPVFDEKYNLVGLIVGQRVNDVDKNKIDWGYVTPLISLQKNLNINNIR